MNPYEAPQTEKQPPPPKRQSTTAIIVFVIVVPVLLGFFFLNKGKPSLQAPGLAKPLNQTLPAKPN